MPRSARAKEEKEEDAAAAGIFRTPAPAMRLPGPRRIALTFILLLIIVVVPDLGAEAKRRRLVEARLPADGGDAGADDEISCPSGMLLLLS